VSLRLLRRSVAIAASASLALMLLGPSTISAATPGWKFTITPTPANGLTSIDEVVAPSGSAGFVVTITNTGKSNISALYLTTDLKATWPNGGAPTYVGPITYQNMPAGTGTCSGKDVFPLNCSFGSLPANDPDSSVTVTVAFQMPASGASFFNFLALGNGNTPSDGGNSHGDTLKGLISINGGTPPGPPATPLVSVTLNPSKDFAGGFWLTSNDVQTDTSLSKKNPQSSAVTPPARNIAVTVEDGIVDFPGSGTNPCGTVVGARCIGDWTKLNVNDGALEPVFTVTLMLYGPSVPNTATVNNINVWHDGIVIGDQPAERGCTTANCIAVTQVGNIFKILLYLDQNGIVRAQH
jgi:hypothetical protein